MLVSLAVAVAVAGTAAPAAHAAATATYSAGGVSAGMTLTDEPGHAGDLSILGGSDTIGALSRAGNITAGAGCTQVRSVEVSCPLTGPRIAIVNLGDGDDRLNFVSNSARASFVRGGDGSDEMRGDTGSDVFDGEGGNDSLHGSAGDDALDGGPGNDTVGNVLDTGNDTKSGGDGSDRLIGSLDAGADVYSGGAGTDVLDFSLSDLAVSVSLDGVADDGRPGEGDDARPDLENVIGSRFGDTLRGDSGRNHLQGGEGDDSLFGGSPPTRTAGRASLLPDDTLDGGLGLDTLRGEGGDDVLLARDAFDDQFRAASSCGGGSDRLDADLADDNTRALPADCESVDQGAIDEGRNVRIASRLLRGGGKGRMRVRLSCPRSVRIGCRGRLAARPPRGAGTAGGTRYRIRRGRSTRVTVRLPASLRRKLERRRRVTARLVSIERGVHGPKTTIRPVSVRR
jgi:Ca2+-binding RTX toxin-like protein